MKWKPHAYQRVGVRWLAAKREAALLWDPGLGKSATTLEAFRRLQAKGKAQRALIVAPRRVCYQVWSEIGEIGQWDQFTHFKVVLLHGPKKEKAITPGDPPDIYVTTTEGLRWLCDNNLIPRLGCDVLVIDELSKFKHTRTKRFRSIKPWLSFFKYRWGLTGSPASNGLLDLFGQAYVLDEGKRLGRYITHYRHAFFYPSGYGGYTWAPAEGAEDRIYAKLGDLALSMRATDYLDLPELIERNAWVELPARARRAYNELHSDLITQINDELVTAANMAVASGKCRQVASGGLYLEDGSAAEVHSAKTEALLDLVDELQGSQLLVLYEFKHEVERLKKVLGKDLAVIGGDTSQKKADTYIKAWNLGALPILCGHPASMGHGLNLQGSGAHHVCWYSMTYDYEHYDQTIRRLWRQGQINTVIVHRILARDTIDEAIIKSVRAKGNAQDALFREVKKLNASRTR